MSVIKPFASKDNVIDDEPELAELRAWMVTNIRGLRDDRSTASYALQFLSNKRRYLNPEIFRQLTTQDTERSIKRMLPTFAALLKVEGHAQMDALRSALCRDIYPQIIEEIADLANEK